MRVLVCGGRHYGDWREVYAMLGQLHDADPITFLIQGGASGADEYAREWAYERGVEHLTIRPKWHKYGNSAGPLRNQEMLEQGKPDLVLAFPGGRGTADMVRRAQEQGVHVQEVT